VPSWFCATTSLYGAVYVPTAGTPSAFLRYWRLPKLQVSRRFVESSSRRSQRIGVQGPFEDRSPVCALIVFKITSTPESAVPNR
jgi:hypothetical protein